MNQLQAKSLVITTMIVGTQFACQTDAHSQDLMKPKLLNRFAATNPSIRAQRREHLQALFNQVSPVATNGARSIEIAGLKVALWEPSLAPESKLPLVIFSHGFHGSNTQSAFLMRALAKAGYLVIAPDHRDAHWPQEQENSFRPEISFKEAGSWNDRTYKNRALDICNLLCALHEDSDWNCRIDWSKVALAGHSLGGYTVLGLAGAWPSWRVAGIKAVIALSPYCQPYVVNGTLGALNVPVMFQGGSRDWGITPFIARPGGAFSKVSSPAYLVELDKAGHLAWSNFNRNEVQQQLIDYYCVSFLDKYVQGKPDARPEIKQPGVVRLQVK